MKSLSNPKTIWLLLTNILLGFAVVACCAMIALCLFKDIRRKGKQRREEALVPPDYLDGLTDLGVTLSEGGEKIDEMLER